MFCDIQCLKLDVIPVLFQIISRSILYIVSFVFVCTMSEVEGVEYV